MKKFRGLSTRWTALAALAFFSLVPTSSFACSVCYGDPDSPMIHGARAGVLVLGVFVYCVLAVMASVVLMWMMRAKKLAAAEAQAQLQAVKIPEDFS